MAWSWEVDDVPNPDDWEYTGRANGNCLCRVCWQPYWSHWQPAKQTCPTLVVDCKGQWWKT